MGSNSNKRWYHIIRSRILGQRDVPVVDGDSDGGEGKGAEAPVCDNPEVRTVADADAPKTPERQPSEDVTRYDPPPAPEDAPPQVLGQISDGTSMMYVQTAFWVASYVQMRAQRGDFTQDQLIEQFGVNVRRCINPDWKPSG